MSDREHWPAFPSQYTDELICYSGMTLHDYYAASAPSLPKFLVPGLIERPGITEFDAVGLSSPVFSVRLKAWAQLHALWSLAYADAMIAN